MKRGGECTSACICMGTQVLWRRGPSLTYNGPALDLPLGGYGPKVNTNERGLEYFIPTKFGEYPSSDSVVKSDYPLQSGMLQQQTGCLAIVYKHFGVLMTLAHLY